MRRSAFALFTVLTLAGAAPLWAAEQNAQVEVGPPKPVHDVGIAVASAMFNVVYFPARLALTTVMAGVGGAAGWISGGDRETSSALWSSTDGQAFITPAILERKETLRLGHSNWDR